MLEIKAGARRPGAGRNFCSCVRRTPQGRRRKILGTPCKNHAKFTSQIPRQSVSLSLSLLCYSQARSALSWVKQHPPLVATIVARRQRSRASSCPSGDNVLFAWLFVSFLVYRLPHQEVGALAHLEPLHRSWPCSVPAAAGGEERNHRFLTAVCHLRNQGGRPVDFLSHLRNRGGRRPDLDF